MTEPITGVATADLHLGIDNVGGLDENGVPRRLNDFLDNFEGAVDYAIDQMAHLFIIAGDIFKHRNPPQRTLYLFLQQVRRLIDCGVTVVIVKGNHEGDSDTFRANVLDTIQLYGAEQTPSGGQVVTFNHPRRQDVTLRGGETVTLIGIPWPRIRQLIPEAGDMEYDELCAAADAAVRETLDDLCRPVLHDLPCRQVLIGHLAVADADKGSERWMTLGWEPTIRTLDIPPEVAVAIFGHYHHGGLLCRSPLAFYCGSIARIDFGEEGQDKMFWTFEIDAAGAVTVEPHIIPDRPFITIAQVGFDPALADVTDLVIDRVFHYGATSDQGGIPQPDIVKDAVVRLRIDFATAEQAATFNEEKVAAALRAAGAWWIAEIHREAPDASRRWEGIENIESMEPPDALWRFLAAKEADETRCRRVWTAGLEVMAGQPAD